MLIFLNLFIIVCMFVIGALFGSFFSLATYRIPRHQDIVATRSYCTSCKHRLGFFDLFPVLSYIIRMGKCKYCGEKISIRYFLLEVSNGLIFVAMYLIFGYTLNLLFVAVIYALLFVLIGSLIMKSKMTEKEVAQVEKMKTQKDELHAKRGIFVTELIIAMILFTLLIGSSYILSRNYINKNILTVAKSNAVSLAVKNIEMAIGTEYDSLNSFSNVEKVDNITYTVDTSVYKYSDQDFTKKDLVKTIETKVTYMINGKNYDFSIKTLKGKVL